MKNVQQLLNEEVSKFHEQQQLHDSNPITHSAPAHLPSLNLSHYGMILSHIDGDNENGLCHLLPAFTWHLAEKAT